MQSVIVSKPADAAKLSRPRKLDSMQVGEGYTLVVRMLSQDSSELVVTKPIPYQSMERYCRAAMKKAEYRKFEDETYYAEIPLFKGVWAREETLQDCLNVLNEVLVDWLLLKIHTEDHDIPVLEGIDLNSL